MSAASATETEAVVEAAKPGSRPDGGSLRGLVLKGAVWTILGYGCAQVLRLTGSLVLTRLLEPELFGLMTLAQTALVGMAMFSDIGASVSVVRNSRGEDPSFLNTAWTLQLIRGMVMWLGTVLLAHPLALFYGDPRLNLLIPLVGFSGLLYGFMSTNPLVLNRRLAVKTLAIFEIGTQTVSLVILIGIVWAWPTIWALVVGGIINTMLRVVVSHKLLPEFKNHLAWDRSALKELLTFGKWIFLSTASMFLGEQADRFVLGKLLSFQMLGIYGIASNLADVPRSVTTALSNKVVFPAIARQAHRPRGEMRAAILRNRKLPLIGIALSLALFVGVGDQVIKILYDPRYHQSSWILPLLALSIWPRVLCNLSDPALYAVGRPQYSTIGSLSRFVVTVGGLILGYSLAGLPGAVIAASVRDLFYYVPIAIGLYRERLSVLAQDAMLTGLLLAVVLVVVSVRRALGLGTPWDGMI